MARPANPIKSINRLLVQVEEMAQRILTIEEIQEMQKLEARVAEIRDRFVVSAHAQGMSGTDMKNHFKLSPFRISQTLAKYRNQRNGNKNADAPADPSGSS